jgi:DNA-binding NtrC family response regulator
VKQVAQLDLQVAVTGETGTGKELIGRALHDAGPRRGKRFLVLDCGSLVPELLRSELFGHEKGAFTGAERTTQGILESSAGGTVFLDEVGEIDPNLQPQLLRALETREISRLGSRDTVAVDFRIVSATNRNLRDLAAAGKFRQDLFYRLTCITIQLPSLRERREDIPMLIEHFTNGCAERHKLPPPPLPPEVMQVLVEYHWPGNVRQLRNTMEALVALSVRGPVRPEDVRQVLSFLTVPEAPAAAPATALVAPPAPASPGQAPREERSPLKLDDIERIAIENALASTGWNQRAAARQLGVSPTTIQHKIKKYGLKPPDAG